LDLEVENDRAVPSCRGFYLATSAFQTEADTEYFLRVGSVLETEVTTCKCS
jgi:hypothetical protein